MDKIDNAWDIVKLFEHTIANFAGATYGVAVDTGTDAIHLCLEWFKTKNDIGIITIPKKTYLSVPCSIIHAGGKVKFNDLEWTGEYNLSPYPIIDSACRFKKGMHYPNTFRCLSFQYKKHLKIGRGGMILHDCPEANKWFRLARFSGRHEVILMEDTPAMIGWHCFMEPERAARGLQLFSLMNDFYPDDLIFKYPDLESYKLYDQ